MQNSYRGRNLVQLRYSLHARYQQSPDVIELYGCAVKYVPMSISQGI